MREGSGTKSRRSSPRTDGLGTHPFCMPGRRVDRRTRSLRRRTKIPRYARILIIFFSCGGMSCSCQWYRVCDAGALRAEPLATLMSCAVKNIKFAHQGSTNGMSTTRPQVHPGDRAADPRGGASSATCRRLYVSCMARSLCVGGPGPDRRPPHAVDPRAPLPLPKEG